MSPERRHSQIEWPEHQRGHALRNTSLVLTALAVTLVLVSGATAASAPPSEMMPGFGWMAAAFLVGVCACCCWLLTAIAAIVRWVDDR